MAKFLFTYHGGSGMPESAAEQEAVMAQWGAWFGELGAAIVDGGNPTGASKTVVSGGVSDGVAANGATGYTLVSADSLDAASELAKGCPVLGNGGSVEVYETIDM